MSYLSTAQTATTLCHELFGQPPLDGDGQDGCFDSMFDYYHTDSEQAFLEWLDQYAQYYKDQKGRELNTPTFIESVSPVTLSQSTIIKTEVIETEFLSYFDMCPACRGTFSHLLGDNEDIDSQGAKESWYKKRVKKFITGFFKEKYDCTVLIAEPCEYKISCTSLAPCQKGVQP